MTTSQSINLPWVESPFFAQELSKANLMPVLAEQVQSFATDGYLIFDPEIDEPILDAAREGVQPLYGNDLRTQDAWQTVPAVRQIATRLSSGRLTYYMGAKKFCTRLLAP